MDTKIIDFIFKSFIKRPKLTILVLPFLVLGIVMVTLGYFYTDGYFGEMGKQDASDNGTGKKVATGTQIDEIKTGDKSPVVLGDNATINYYDVSPAVVDDSRKRFNLDDRVLERLLKTLDEKDVAIKDRDAKFIEMAQKYKGLEERLAKRSAEDELAAQAKQKLEDGNLEDADKILLQSLQKNLQANAEKRKAAASDAFDLGSVKELQLDYAGAKKFYEQAVQLEPDNTDYMNKVGFIFDKLGDYQKANDYYKKALAINRKVYGDQRSILPPKFFTNLIGMEFVLIPAGIFRMGSAPGSGFGDEHPQHPVEITQPFYLQTTEVTQGQWQKVMGNNPSKFKNCSDDCPVEMVSWDDTQKFIKKLNDKEGTDTYRLPTEAEWEYAARAGTTTEFFFGDDARQLGEYAWYKDNSMNTHPVGQKEPNPWGLYDIIGNVWEWVEDDWHNNYDGAPYDGSAWIVKTRGILRVVRGGSWGGGSWEGGAHNCRSANRYYFVPVARTTYIGFRLAMSVTLGP